MDESKSMPSVIVKSHGEYGFGTIDRNEPGPGQVLIEVDSAPLNPSDIYFMRGMWGIKHEYPFTPGWEGAGTVVGLGPGVPAEMLQTRVAFSMCKQEQPWKIGGSLAKYCVTYFPQCIKLRDDVSFEEGACSFVNPLSALAMIDRCKELKAKAVLITAAASALCKMAIKLCIQQGMIPICVVRRAE